jgi:hypothetical protein
MWWKLAHSPIAFAEFRIKIVCTGWQFYNIAELIRKLEKKICLRPSLKIYILLGHVFNYGKVRNWCSLITNINSWVIFWT